MADAIGAAGSAVEPGASNDPAPTDENANADVEKTLQNMAASFAQQLMQGFQKRMKEAAQLANEDG
jgi:hypothetical protein